jgi:AbiTii-like protein
MVGRSNTLLDEIESDALDETKPLIGALRKCVALGGQADSAALRDWATRELKGYPPDGDLPGFRVIPAPIMIEGATPQGIVKNQQIPLSTLPDFVQENISEEVRFYSGVGEIEELARSAERSDEPAKLQLPMGGDVARLMNADFGPGQQIVSVYWAVSPVSLRGLCDQIRTNLVQLVAEIRVAIPNGAEVPTPEAADNAINVIVHGKRAKVKVAAAQASGGSYAMLTSEDSGAESGPWTTSRRIGAASVGVATIAAAIFAGIEVF